MMLLQWWRQREKREQVILLVGVVITTFVLIYLLIEPVLKERSRMSADIPALQSDLIWMQSHVQEIQNLMSTGSNNIGTKRASLSLSSVQTILSEMSLSQKVKELSPMASQGIRLNFTEIQYPDLIELMFKLESITGARISNAQFSLIENNTGVVQATLILTQG
jgi:type II secretory pathway component PulM